MHDKQAGPAALASHRHAAPAHSSLTPPQVFLTGNGLLTMSSVNEKDSLLITSLFPQVSGCECSLHALRALPATA